MLLSIDYDETYTRDPLGWGRCIALMQARGHRVVCVTMRHEREGAEGMAEMGVPVYYTGRRAKEPWARAHGLSVDVWIDDSPRWLVTDAGDVDTTGEEMPDGLLRVSIPPDALEAWVFYDPIDAKNESQGLRHAFLSGYLAARARPLRIVESEPLSFDDAE